MGLITDVWHPQAGRFFCIATRGVRWREYFFTRDQFADISEFVRDHKDDDIYFCPHAFSKPSRLSKYYVASNWLWADLDEVDPRILEFTPTVAWETSPGRHQSLWQLDAEPSQELRKRFNDAVGADAGGWSLSKVLRVPGTRNHKYEDTPMVRLLWTDGPVHMLRDLRRKYGYKIHNANNEVITNLRIDGDWREILRRRGALSLTNYVASTVIVGKRSEVIWKIGKTLREKGATPDEVACVLIASKAWQSKHGNNRAALSKEVTRIFS